MAKPIGPRPKPDGKGTHYNKSNSEGIQKGLKSARAHLAQLQAKLAEPLPDALVYTEIPKDKTVGFFVGALLLYMNENIANFREKYLANLNQTVYTAKKARVRQDINRIQWEIYDLTQAQEAIDREFEIKRKVEVIQSIASDVKRDIAAHPEKFDAKMKELKKMTK